MVLNLVLGRAGGRSVALQGRAGPPEPESELELSLRPAAQWTGGPGTCPVLLCSRARGLGLVHPGVLPGTLVDAQ